MSKNIRIRTEPNGGDTHLKIQLNQDFDFLEILSLKISQEYVYRTFYSDYGVVVGRVIINSGVGVPNAKVSIFIPLDEVDAQIPEISALYPYTDITVANGDGVRYNTLPNNSQGDCHTPIGTFPNKRELVDNELLLDIHQKYYKFNTTTNDSGDFMIFGVPVGNHMINVDVDLSDIGIFSQRPYDFIAQGIPSKNFESSNKFKGGTNLNNLSQLKNIQMGVNVIPFWGEEVENEVGISRIDVDLNYNLEPKAIFVGAIFGDNDKNSVNKRCRPRRKLGKVCEMNEGGGVIEMIRKTIFGDTEIFNIEGGRVIDDNGAWAYQIPMNLDYVVTDEQGNLVPTDDATKGFPTKAKVRFKIGMDVTGGEGRLRTRGKYLVPNNPETYAKTDYTFDENTTDENFRDLSWNKIYTVKNHIARYQKNSNDNNRNFIGFKDVDDCVGDKSPIPYNTADRDANPLFTIICVIIDIIVALSKVVSIVKKVYLPCNGDRYRISHRGSKDDSGEFKDCIRESIAELLNVYELDFYNEWLNGSLYGFLLKYKHKKKRADKFCGDGSINLSNHLLNTNVKKNNGSKDLFGHTEVGTSDGVIVSYNGELLYKPMSNSNHLMYATDIYNLGSVFECDWQGIPNLQSELITTTYQKPPSTLDDDDDGLTIDNALFEIECRGLKADSTQGHNVQVICEIGIDMDKNDDIPYTNHKIDNDNISGGLLRNKLITLNTELYKDENPYNINSNFDSGPTDDIDTTYYDNYRNIKDNGIQQTFGNSFYFYFGTKPNKTALDVMNSKYFNTCTKPFVNPITINGEVIDVSTVNGQDGSISVTVVGGSEPYTYLWSSDEIISGDITSSQIDGLSSGFYTVQVIDSNDNISEKRFKVNGLQPLTANIIVENALLFISGDTETPQLGSINVNSISGGIGPYYVKFEGPQTNLEFFNVPFNQKIEDLIEGLYFITIKDEQLTTILRQRNIITDVD